MITNKTISYAITANNEHEELDRLLTQIMSKIRPEDEILIQLDSNSTEEVKAIAQKYNVGTKFEYHRIFKSLSGDFASFKNHLKRHCTRDFIFFLDADEYLSDYLIEILPEILESNDVDLINVPRINIVEGIGFSHVQKWGWSISKNKNYISEREFDLENPKDLDNYDLLKKYNLIIEENIITSHK